MLTHIKRRVQELETLAEEVLELAKTNQPGLTVKGQQWYRGAGELLRQHKFSGLGEFEECYIRYPQQQVPGRAHSRSNSDLEAYFSGRGAQGNFDIFKQLFAKARSLAQALEQEILSRELPVKTELSMEVAASELDTAQDMLDKANGAEVFLRAAGVIARVALERHLFTVADARQVPITKNPPTKKHADFEDVLQSLQKAGIITAVQKSQFDSLFKVATNCAHAKEAVVESDVQRLVRDGKQLAAVVV